MNNPDDVSPASARTNGADNGAGDARRCASQITDVFGELNPNGGTISYSVEPVIQVVWFKFSTRSGRRWFSATAGVGEDAGLEGDVTSNSEHHFRWSVPFNELTDAVERLTAVAPTETLQDGAAPRVAKHDDVNQPLTQIQDMRDRVPPASKGTTVTELSTQEQIDFNELDKVVADGLATFVEVGAALKRIKGERLYRHAGYKTFEDYVCDRHYITRQYAYRLIDATDVMTLLSPIGDKSVRDSPLPKTESQARELTVVPQEELVKVWNAVVDDAQAGSSGITAKLIRTHTSRFRQKTSIPDDGGQFDEKEQKKLVAKLRSEISRWPKEAIQQIVAIIQRVIEEYVSQQDDCTKTGEDASSNEPDSREQPDELDASKVTNETKRSLRNKETPKSSTKTAVTSSGIRGKKFLTQLVKGWNDRIWLRKVRVPLAESNCKAWSNGWRKEDTRALMQDPDGILSAIDAAKSYLEGQSWFAFAWLFKREGRGPEQNLAKLMEGRYADTSARIPDGPGQTYRAGNAADSGSDFGKLQT